MSWDNARRCLDGAEDVTTTAVDALEAAALELTDDLGLTAAIDTLGGLDRVSLLRVASFLALVAVRREEGEPVLVWLNRLRRDSEDKPGLL